MFQMKLFLLVLSLVAGVHTVFFEEPSSATVAENEVAVFRCRINSGVQAWTVDGEVEDTLLVNRPDIATHSDPASDGGPPVHTLKVVGRSANNGTTVQCFAFSFSGNSNSSIATLQIQGLLAMVPELSATPLAGSILFSWAAPFSLNLTNTEPDITYCVDVLSSGGAGLVAGGCGLNETQYSFTADVRSPCDTFTAVVTPVNGAGNGSTASVNGYFFEAPMLSVVPTISYKFVNKTHEGQELDVSFKEVVSVRVCTCELVFRSSDGIVPHLDVPITIDEATCQKVLEGNGSFILNTTSTLSADSTTVVMLNRIYSLEIMLSNSAGSYTTPPNRLSTHAVQDLHMMDSNSVTMLVVDFIENTVAPGCVVIITDYVVEYTFVGYLSDGNHTDTLIISGLSKDQHVIAAYDLDTSTRPGRYMATNESVDPNTERVSSSSGVEIEGAVKSEGKVTQPSADRMVCAQCSNTTATECLLLLHPVGNLTEIETLRVRNNQENCTRVSNAGDYIYSIFGVQGHDIIELSSNGSVIITVNITTPLDGSNFHAVIVVPALLGIIIIIVISVLLYSVCWKKYQLHKFKLPVYTTQEIVIERIASLQSLDVESSITRLVPDRIVSDSTTPLQQSPLLQQARFSDDTSDPNYASVGSPEKVQVLQCIKRMQDQSDSRPRTARQPHLSVKITAEPMYDNSKPPEMRQTCRMATDSCSPTLQHSSPDLPAPDLPPPFTGDVPDSTYDSVKPAEKHAAAKGASTGPVYTTTKPNTKFQAPPAQDLSTNYDVVKGFKSQEGSQYAFPDVKASKKTETVDKHVVTYDTVTHTVPSTSVTGKGLTSSLFAVVTLTKQLLCTILYPVMEKWKVLAAQFKINEDLIDEIYTNNDRDEDCLKEMIGYWYQNRDFRHTWSEVVTALEAIGEHTLAKKIRTDYVTSEIDDPTTHHPCVPQHAPVPPLVPAFVYAEDTEEEPSVAKSTQPVFLSPRLEFGGSEDSGVGNEHAELSTPHCPDQDSLGGSKQAVFMTPSPPSYGEACDKNQDTCIPRDDLQYISHAKDNMCASAVSEESSKAGSITVSSSKIATASEQEESGRVVSVRPTVHPDEDTAPGYFSNMFSYEDTGDDIVFLPVQSSVFDDSDGKLTLERKLIVSGSKEFTISSRNRVTSLKVDYMTRVSSHDDSECPVHATSTRKLPRTRKMAGVPLAPM